jgi:hypothetical protein
MISYFKNCLTQNQKVFVTFGQQKFKIKNDLNPISIGFGSLFQDKEREIKVTAIR